MAKRDTKSIILESALQLFSEQGFHGTSMRDIAQAVGIRESSIYKHFNGKQDIFHSLVAEMDRRYEEKAASIPLPQGDFFSVARQYDTAGLELIEQSSQALFLFYLKDPYAAPLRRMLTTEQFRDPTVKDVFRKIYIESALQNQSRLFQAMIQVGHFIEADPEIMALQFFSPIFLLMYKYDGYPEQEAEALRELKRHLEQFEKIYARPPMERKRTQ